MAPSTAIGGGTDSTALVGTPDTVVAALLDCAALGVTTFLNRGYDPLYDALDYGRWITVPSPLAGPRRQSKFSMAHVWHLSPQMRIPRRAARLFPLNWRLEGVSPQPVLYSASTAATNHSKLGSRVR